MFHLFAFASSTTGTIGSALNIPPATDPVAAINGNFLFVPQLSQFLGAYALGTNLLRAQISSPSLLALVPFDVTPIDTGSVPSTMSPVAIQQSSPLALIPDEPLSVVVTTGGAGLAVVAGLLADGPIAPVSGAIAHVRGTIATGTSQTSWQNSALTLTNQLAEGTYDLVGVRVEGTHGRFYRVVFPGSSQSVRPGGPFSNGVNGIDADYQFRNGQMGVWGTFSNRVLPTFDNLTDGTGETATVILDVIKRS